MTRPLAGGTPGQQKTAKLDAVFQYDNEGKMTSMKTPDYWITGNPNQQTGETFNYTYDTMARLTGLTQSGVSQALVNSIVYGGANQITQLNYGDGTIQTRTYNARLQVTRMTSGTDLDVEYQYSGTANNGQIGMRWDHLSGEQVTYQYDSLKRLTAAGTTTGAAPWSQTYGYDGFGNRTSLNGAATAYDPATNRMLSASYDANGNTASMAGFVANGLVYDVDNRLVSASPTSGGLEQYGYNHNNQWVWRKKAGGAEEFYFYNLNGQRLGVFTGATGDGSGNFFFGRVSLDSVIPKGLQRKRDRLGSTFDGGTTRYFPYGEENPATSTNDRDKFATYQRDSTTGLDYAVNRYYGSTMGRFLTADPVGHSNPSDPQTWNQYVYVLGDPINKSDPSGLESEGPPAMQCVISGQPMEGGICEFYWDAIHSGVNTSTGKKQTAPPGSPEDKRWTKAVAVLSNGNDLLHRVLSGQPSQPCQDDLTALSGIGVSSVGILAMADFVNWNDAAGDDTPASGLVPTNDPDYQMMQRHAGTISQYVSGSSSGGIVAASALPGSALWGNIYFVSGFVSRLSTADAAALLMHELIHTLGPNDRQIQSALFGANSPEVGKSSVNISDKLRQDCFK